MRKRDALDALARGMASAQLPLMPANFVFGEGDPDARVMFVGEAPGAREDLEGRPFVGRSGKLLGEMLVSIGWRREDVYITNIVKRRPPENRDPSPEEIAAYAPYLARQIEIIAPRVIVPLGRFAMNHFLPAAKITRDQGTAFREGDRIIYPILHPAAAMRGSKMMARFKESFAGLSQAARVRMKKESARDTMKK